MDSEGPRVVRGTRVVRGLLERAVDVRALDLEGFRRWLGEQLPRWASDPAFAARARLRDLRRAHPELRALERAHRRALEADAATPEARRLLEVEEALSRLGKAVDGVAGALERTHAPERRTGLRHKLTAFREQQQVLRREQRELIHTSAPRQELLRVRAALSVLRVRLGWTQLQSELSGLSHQEGLRAGRAGGRFEEQVLPVTWRCIVPDLARGGDASRLRLLRGVGLGAARTELDQVLIRQPLHPGRPVEVLALVEVKRNPDDLAHGFHRRQENLAWFTGDVGHYDPLQYKNRFFRSGHFDGEAVHTQDGERFVFTRGSFRRFVREPDQGPFLRRLYFIIREGTLHGLSTAALARIRHRLSVDAGWSLEHKASLEALRRWCQSLSQPQETPDVLRLYGASPGRARQVLVVGTSP